MSRSDKWESVEDLAREDIIDSRDMEKKIDELESEEEGIRERLEELRAELQAEKISQEELCELQELAAYIAPGDVELLEAAGVPEGTTPELDSLQILLKALREVRDECGSEWRHGVTYIRESYWQTYAQELAEDIGAIPKDLTWPACHIDWDAACDALAQDYSQTEIDGITFYYRD